MGLRLPQDLASRAAALSLGSNLVLMVLKLAVGLIAGSVAVLSDGIDSAQDVLASAIAFASVRYARRPADPSHPYGHGRLETMAAMAQGVLISIGAAYITYRSIDRLLYPPDRIDTGLGLAAMVVTAAVNLVVVQYVARVARLTRSPAIASDARHLWTNVVQAGAILVGLLLVGLTGRIELDGLTALLLAGYLAWTAGRIFWESFADVLDSSLTPDELNFIRGVIAEHGGEVRGFHDLRTRRSGQHRYIDFHLDLPGDMTIAQSHLISDQIERRIREHWPTAQITTHIDPVDGAGYPEHLANRP